MIGSALALGGALEIDRTPPDVPTSEPVGPVLTLDDATSADLTPVFQSVNKGFSPAAFRFVDGVTEDGQVIVRDTTDDPGRSRLQLVDLGTGAEEPLPDLPGRDYSLLEGNRERIVYNADQTSIDNQTGAPRIEVRALVLDRASETWREMRWPDLPVGAVLGRDVGPDGRMYVAINPVPAGVTATGVTDACSRCP